MQTRQQRRASSMSAENLVIISTKCSLTVITQTIYKILWEKLKPRNFSLETVYIFGIQFEPSG